jgi:hypothetical protein
MYISALNSKELAHQQKFLFRDKTIFKFTFTLRLPQSLRLSAYGEDFKQLIKSLKLLFYDFFPTIRHTN